MEFNRLEYRQKWNKNNPEKVKSTEKRRAQKLRTTLFKILGGAICVFCACQTIMALQFEHKNANGRKDRDRFSGKSQFLRYYRDHPEEAQEKLQITCANCNFIKRYKNSEEN